MSKQLHAERMNKVIQFIEDNLDTEIDCAKLAEIACYSKFHFHRIFNAYVGESVYAYRKRLLLERAVNYLLYSSLSITEIAFKCGYKNQASFNKAFKKQFSCTPTQVRKRTRHVNLAKTQSMDKEVLPMKAEIVELEKIPVVYMRAQGPYAEAVPEAWRQLMQVAQANGLINGQTKLFGIPHDNPTITKPDNVRYDACIGTTVNIDGDTGLRKKTIAGGQYAKFVHQGPYDKLGQAYAFIFSEWLPENQHKLRDEPCFEHYLNNDLGQTTKPEQLKTEIYIPIE